MYNVGRLITFASPIAIIVKLIFQEVPLSATNVRSIFIWIFPSIRLNAWKSIKSYKPINCSTPKINHNYYVEKTK